MNAGSRPAIIPKIKLWLIIVQLMHSCGAFDDKNTVDERISLAKTAATGIRSDTPTGDNVTSRCNRAESFRNGTSTVRVIRRLDACSPPNRSPNSILEIIVSTIAIEYTICTENR